VGGSDASTAVRRLYTTDLSDAPPTAETLCEGSLNRTNHALREG
jgi:hypothetical protein